MVHPGITSIIRESSDKSRSFFIVEERSCLWPIGDPPFGNDTGHHCQKSLEDEDPIDR
jgi:hypothetical protein